METTKEKAMQFLTALVDVYRDEGDRELWEFPKMEMPDEFTDDFTALLLAFRGLVQQLTGYDGDLIDFTHLLNKLAVQFVIENNGEAEDGK